VYEHPCGFVMSASNIIDLVSVVAWPLAAVVLALVLRPAVPGILRELGRRATKLSFFPVALALAPPAPRPEQPPLRVNVFNEPIADPSFLPALFGQLLVAAPADYMVVDLAAGKSWLTSRLFIWAEMLQRVRGLRCLVFVRNENGENGLTGRFCGIASPDEVRRRLASRYPWFERDLAAAFAEVLAPAAGGGHNDPVDRETGVITQSAASRVVVEFMNRVQIRPMKADDKPDKKDWVLLPRDGTDPEVWEHARWIDPARLPRLFRPALDQSYVVRSLRASRRDIAHAVLRGQGQFVALVDERYRFDQLADRGALLEQTAAGLWST
jgi:hypothetical protein